MFDKAERAEFDSITTYPSPKVLSQEFCYHLSGCLNNISVPFALKIDKPFDEGIVPFPCSHSP